jgi:type I restriction enzyme R subunit
MDHALLDPLSGEIGKTICFCVSQAHASKVTQLLNEMAMERFPGRYNSDFAIQITSNIPDAQQHSIHFANNNLNGHTRFLDGYKSAKTRVCVTVGMMTTGYDCQDILNLAMMRPIFSPTDFIQIKGRGTRTFTFKHIGKEGSTKMTFLKAKEHFKLFDFFANYEFFEEKFSYDEVLKLPAVSPKIPTQIPVPVPVPDGYTNVLPDPIHQISEIKIGLDGMKIDRKLFERFSRPILDDAELVKAVNAREWERAVQIMRDNYANRPEDYVTLEKLMQNEKVDRRLSWKEVLMRIFGLIERFKTRDELLEEEFQKFVAVNKPEPESAMLIRNYLHAYITDAQIRQVIDTGNFPALADNPKLTLDDLARLGKWLKLVPAYVKDYVTLNTYLP